MFQWTKVSHSRRRRHSPPRGEWPPLPRWRPPSPPWDPRPPSRSWDHDRGRVRGVRARAPPLPHGGGYLPTLLLPVPPPRALLPRGSGTWTGTRAGSAPGPDREEDRHGILRLPADPALRLLTRRCYLVIKVVHHLRQVSPGAGGPGPRTFSGTVDHLATFIRPAAPTPTTGFLLEGAAIEWGNNVCTILRQHYEDILKGLLEDMADAGLLRQDWGYAFSVALRWAHKNLPRITEASIGDAEARLQAAAGEVVDPTPPPPEVLLLGPGLPAEVLPPPAAWGPQPDGPPPPGPSPPAALPRVRPLLVPLRPPPPKTPPRVLTSQPDRSPTPVTTPRPTPSVPSTPVHVLGSCPPTPRPTSPPPVRLRRPPPTPPPVTPSPTSPPPASPLSHPPPAPVDLATPPVGVPRRVTKQFPTLRLYCSSCNQEQAFHVEHFSCYYSNTRTFHLTCYVCGKREEATNFPLRPTRLSNGIAPFLSLT